MIDVRVANLDEAGALAELHLRSALAAYGHIFPPEAPPPTLDHLLSCWRSWLDSEASVGFVAEAAGGPVGVVLAGADPVDASIGHISRMYVAPERWGHGVGRSLYSAAITHLLAVGYVEATLWVLEANHRARGWYERLGWTATGERRTVFRPSAIDDLRYKRELNR